MSLKIVWEDRLVKNWCGPARRADLFGGEGTGVGTLPFSLRSLHQKVFFGVGGHFSLQM